MFALALLAIWFAAAAGQVSPEPIENGVVIVEVAEGSALYASGIRRGDRIVSWQRPVREPAGASRPGGEFRSTFDWEWVKVEQAPRGVVELRGWRGSESRVFSVPSGSWHGDVRPPLPQELLAGLAEGLELIASERTEQGIRRARATRSAPDLSCWLSFRVGDALSAAGRLPEALAVYGEALGEARDPAAQVVVWDAIGAVRQRLGESGEARDAYLAALEIRRLNWSGESLSVAKSRTDLGNLAWNRGNLKLAAEHHRHSMDIRQALAPGSLAVAGSLQALGVVVGLSGDLEASTDYALRALAIQEELAPGSLAVAESLNHLGILAGMAGRRALAEEYFSRALAIREVLAPGSLGVAANSINLGRIAWKRGNFDGAHHHYRAALTIQEKLAPGSENLATLLSNLGLLASDRGELDAAEAYYQRALAIREKLGPGSMFVADSFFHLGQLAVERGQPAIAEGYLQRALAIQERVTPGSLSQADSLFELGKVMAQRGDRAVAAGHHQRALTIRETLAPDSKEEAESLYALGRLERGTDLEQAAKLFERAIDSLEAQIGMLGGSEDVKSGFRARYHPLYQDLIEALLELDRKAEAFHTLERSRARSFLAMLTEKDLLFSADLPVELETARRKLTVQYDRTLERLFRVSPAEGERFESLAGRLAGLRRERDRLVADIRRASPRLGELQYPEPLDLARTREALDPGTVMLSYNVGPRATHIFALTRDSFEVARVDLAESDLREQIRLFRRLIQGTGASTEIQAIRRSQLVSAGRQLYQSLVLPVAERIARGERMLIIPDGPLHVLPFRALILEPEDRQAKPKQGPRYLIEWKPLHTAMSATVYSELRKTRGAAGERPPAGGNSVLLTAFGDPSYPRDLKDLKPLPHSRQEVEGITGLYPPLGVRAYLGDAATEEQAKSVGRETQILHFATHATLVDRFPLHSALALSIPEKPIPGRDNGWLQTFEIFERLRLDADLVILSACETALGQELAGEGLIGLTRAFQYAGARTVAASLWSVRDEATAELMVHFHRKLESGSSKAEALRAAQVEFIHKDASPFVWAAFELYGDWR